LNSIKGNDNTLSSKVKNNNKWFEFRYNKNNFISSNRQYIIHIKKNLNYNISSRNTINYNLNDKLLELYNDLNNSNMNISFSNIQYNKPFISLNLNNGNNTNLEDRIKIIIKYIQLPSNIFLINNLTSRNSIKIKIIIK